MTQQDSSTFAGRLKTLKGTKSNVAFASQVGISESLLRKYLAGSEPSLSKANQIAYKANCSLEWLATGQGYQYRKAEVVDVAALSAAHQLITESFATEQGEMSLDTLKKVVACYQFLRSYKKKDGYLDIDAAHQFILHMESECNS
ncbi:hypothetical protein C2869_01410 [Saccharobesus litoralis]|uniref:HTH cro/C1-type domain-containing protein n=1 Tax=Saccharobesus litoralis TaxID=2172099 RepID=A0A2S0VLU7_9ALTE|nr:hypothetical protein [Saccharobesus litoralis]AWB65183.1 hypothetical protein C2869_01410 [Saccharobesus litoralis]